MINQESEHRESSLSQNIEGFHIMKFDSKHRFGMPMEWRGELSGHDLVLLYTGNYGILMKKEIFENNIEPGVIVHTTTVDKHGRIVIPSNFLKAYNIYLETDIAMIGRGNHVELYFKKENFIQRKHESIRAATVYQAMHLLGLKK